MPTPIPDWLTRRGGTLKLASDGKTRFLMLGGEPTYTLVPRPVANKFGCFIMQTNSGQPVPSPSSAANEEEAVAASLEDLRKNLGW